MGAGGKGLRVAVASDQVLVAEAVRAALGDRGFEVVSVRWPAEPLLPLPRRPSEPPLAVGVLISELDRWTRLWGALRLIRHVPTRWLVLTSIPVGYEWGAVLEAGADLVLPGEVSLDELCAVLPAVAAGRLATPEEERQALVERWVTLL